MFLQVLLRNFTNTLWQLYIDFYTIRIAFESSFQLCIIKVANLKKLWQFWQKCVDRTFVHAALERICEGSWTVCSEQYTDIYAGSFNAGRAVYTSSSSSFYLLKITECTPITSISRFLSLFPSCLPCIILVWPFLALVD